MHASPPARHASLATLLALLAVSRPLLAQEAERFVSRAGEHYRVVCHFEDEVVAGLALEAAEAAWPFAAELYGASASAAPEEPYRIHLLPDAASYLQLEERLTYGAFANNLAFSSWKTKESYVAMQPQRAPLAGWPVLPMLTRRLIAHEAAHLVQYHADPGFASHPTWVSEGIAELVSDQAMRAKGWADAEVSDPFTASRLEWLRARVDGRDTGFVDAAQRNSAGYVLHGALFSFLQRSAGTEALRDFLADSRSFTHDPELANRGFHKLFHERFAPNGAAALEDAFREDLRARVPLWFEGGRSLERSPDGEGCVQLAFPKNPAVAWRVGESLAGVTLVRAEIEIARGSRFPGATIFLGGREAITNRPRPTAVAIDLDPERGVRVRPSRNPEYEVYEWPDGDAPVISPRRPPLDEPFEVRVRIEGERGMVALDGEDVLPLDLSEMDKGMHLGLGVPRGGLVHWRSLELERAR